MAKITIYPRWRDKWHVALARQPSPTQPVSIAHASCGPASSDSSRDPARHLPALAWRSGTEAWAIDVELTGSERPASGRPRPDAAGAPAPH